MLTSELPGTGGRIREQIEDFVVDEVPAYDASGEGEHTFVRVEKRGLTTDDVVRKLAGFVKTKPSAIGFAGRKDKYAVTTQWLSVPDTDPEVLETYTTEGLRVLEAKRHGHKLRTGHLKGNRFEIVVRDVVEDAIDRARVIVEQIEREGLPNLYGVQRFGDKGRNVDFARSWIIGGGRRPRSKRKCRLLVSSLQAQLFNDVVFERLARGAFSSTK